jgi:hypothetical protein
MPSFRVQSVWGKNPLAETTSNHWTWILEGAQKPPRKHGSCHSNPNQAFEDYATLALGLHTLMTIRHAQGGNTFFLKTLGRDKFGVRYTGLGTKQNSDTTGPDC